MYLQCTLYNIQCEQFIIVSEMLTKRCVVYTVKNVRLIKLAPKPKLTEQWTWLANYQIR